MSNPYGMSTTVSESYDEAIEKVTAALKEQGFGILTQIDMQTTLKNKLGVDIDKYIILGACNPNLANQAMQIEQEMGLLLPCNVIVYETDGTTHVSFLDPLQMMGFAGNDALNNVATDARNRIEKIYAAIQS